MAKTCKNPECVKGKTPGIRVLGAGNARNPIPGTKMHWDWVDCPACSEDPKVQAVYRHVLRSSEEQKQRAEWATSHAAYKAMAPPPLQRVYDANAAGPARPSMHAAPAETHNQLSQLAIQLTRLTEQVTSLLEENRQLRQQLSAATKPSEADQDMISFGSAHRIS